METYIDVGARTYSNATEAKTSAWSFVIVCFYIELASGQNYIYMV